MLDDGATLSLTSGDDITLYDNSKLTTSDADSAIDVAGTGVEITVAGGGVNISLEDDASATVFSDGKVAA